MDKDFGKYYKHIIDNVPGAMIVFGVDEGMLRVRYVSDNCVKISGFTPEETYERARLSPIADAHPDDRQKFINTQGKFNEENLSYTYRIICKDGNYKWVNLKLSKVEEDGEILYYGLFSDIDEQHKREEIVRKEQIEMQNMYQSILDETKAMITIIDAKTYEVVYANKMAVEMANVSEGYVGCTCFKGIHHADKPCRECLLLNDGGMDVETKEVTYAGHTYKMIKKKFLWNGCPALLEYSEDITEERQFRKIEIDLESAKRANVSKTDFLSRMSHDIRTPLNGIIGMTEIARSDNKDEKVEKSLELIDSSSKFLLSLINDVLDISKIESGKMELHEEPVELGAFDEMINSVIRPLMDAKSITFEYEMRCGLTCACIDGVRFNQLFFNLLSNAAKFTHEGGTVAFTADRISGDEKIEWVKFCVIDNGIGMSQEFAQKAFEPFEQDEESNMKLQSQGTGLGLPITKELVDLMDGTIEVESELGKGSKFTVNLPLKVAVSKEKDEILTEKNKSEKIIQGKKILLAEDNNINAIIATRLLESKGISVFHVMNGALAVEAFAEASEEYDAILMDIRMPVLSGLDATKRIRIMKYPKAKTIPIIAMTANAFDEDIAECMEAGMSAHLSKPIDTAKMYEVLSEQIGINS